MQAQVQLNVGTSQAPQPIDLSIAAVGKPKNFNNFMDLKPPEYVPSLVANQREKVRRFMDGLEAHYSGPAIGDIRNGFYSEVFDTALRSESYYKMERTNRANKRASRQGEQQMKRKGNNSSQSSQHPWCSKYGRNHSGRCYGTNRACYTCGEQRHIAKFCPKGDSGSSQATTQMQRNVAGAQTQAQPIRAAP
ncbi:hypothetical protein P3L10_019352 [Capsicum annuum]|uniref:uncharacterized protein LOC124890935 n=1 Tax=Capsicum annuum TaxID=4072 RepID=UPI001FB0D248|nr:uncharacterized protein LOC124890935 [Capsicum annuum]